MHVLHKLDLRSKWPFQVAAHVGSSCFRPTPYDNAYAFYDVLAMLRYIYTITMQFVVYDCRRHPNVWKRVLY